MGDTALRNNLPHFFGENFVQAKRFGEDRGFIVLFAQSNMTIIKLRKGSR